MSNELEVARAAVEESRRIHDWWSKLSAEQKEEAFFIEMRAIYERKTNLLGAILDACAARRVRFVSISTTDLIIFENLKSCAWPLAWHISQSIDIYYGCGNGPQAQINIRLHDDESGVYDLRTKPYTRLAPPVLFETMNTSAIKKKFKNGNLHDYIAAATG